MPSALPAGEPAPADGALPFGDLQTLAGDEFGVYVHIPFCPTRCGYCDFNTYTASELGEGVSQGTYADTLIVRSGWPPRCWAAAGAWASIRRRPARCSSGAALRPCCPPSTSA